MGESGRRQAPDGGWGWVIVAGFAFTNMLTIPTLQSFGLIFRDVFKELEMSATDVSTIINVNSASGMFLGLVNGPLLKWAGFRRVAAAGSLLMFLGLVLTSRASTFLEFILYYGLVNSVGIMLTLASFSLALNTYFSKKRNRASGICMTATGLGPVFMPLVMSELIKWYGVRGTALILAALGLHSLAGALLLRPLPPESREQRTAEEGKPETEARDLELELETCSLLDLEAALVPRKMSEANPQTGPGRREEEERRERRASSSHSHRQLLGPEIAWWSSTDRRERLGSTTSRRLVETLEVDKKADEKEDADKGCWGKLVEIFDLDLLRDPVYRNIWLGMSLAFTAEINFSLSMPLILGERGFDIQESARLMSVLAFTDIIFRFLSPFLGERIDVSARYMYMHSLVMLVLLRTGLTLVDGYWPTLSVCAGLGVAKGVRSVYMTLVIPNHVTLDKLPSASGLQTVLNGLLLFSIGPVLGYLRDSTGSYNTCIYVVNCFTLVTIILWSGEYFLTRRKRDPMEADSK